MTESDFLWLSSSQTDIHLELSSKKGSLSLIYKSTVAGQVAYILDENKEICKSENTGMWYMNQYFKVDPDKGGRILTI